MTKLRFITSSLLAVFAVALGCTFFISSSTVEQSNSEFIAELSAELADMKEELTTLKLTEENEAVSSEPMLGEVILFAGNFAPRGWAFCDGQLLPISSNQALFSLLGTIYGGDGRTTFALPDLRGRTPIGAGNGPGLSTIRQGQKAGAESTTLSMNNLPSHNHLVSGEVPGFAMHPKELEPKYIKGAKSFITVGNESNTQVAISEKNSSGLTGSNQPFSIRNPYVGMRYIIALQGTFPSRS